jgi:hypothetical protein
VIANSTSYWGVTPCSPVKVYRRFGRSCSYVLVVARLAYSPILKMEAVRYSETSINYRTAGLHIPEDGTHRYKCTLCLCCCDNEIRTLYRRMPIASNRNSLRCCRQPMLSSSMLPTPRREAVRSGLTSSFLSSEALLPYSAPAASFFGESGRWLWKGVKS